MAQLIAIAFGIFGIVTIAVVIYRFYIPKTIPPKSDMATIWIFGGKLNAPVAGILGSAWLLLSFGLFLLADSRNADQIVTSALEEMESCHGLADSLQGVIADLEIELAAAPGRTTDDFIVNLRFGLGTPLPSLGSTVEAVLRGTRERSRDMLEISEAAGLSYSPDSGFEAVLGIAAFDYRSKRTAYVKLEGGDVWRISYLGLNKGTGLNRFRFYHVR